MGPGAGDLVGQPGEGRFGLQLTAQPRGVEGAAGAAAIERLGRGQPRLRRRDGKGDQASQPSTAAREGTPPAWTTLPSTTTPGVDMTP